MKRRREWSLARVNDECRSAPAVWLALQELQESRGAAVVTPTREVLAKLAGIKKLRTISEALTALEQAGWIDRIHVPSTSNGHRTTLLRIVIRRGRKTAHTVRAAVEAEKGPKGRGRKTALDFPKGKSAAQLPPLLPETATGREANNGNGTTNIETIERERMAEIRRRRLAAEWEGATT